MTTVTPSGKFRNERGQVAVLFALIFPLFVLLLAFFVNMGLLINQKIRLQNAVDAGTYSAVASMARDMNLVARLNREIHNVYDGNAEHPTCGNWSEGDNYKHISGNRSFNDVFEAESKYWEYQNFYNKCLDQIDNIDGKAVTKAMDRGKNAALLTFYNGDAVRAAVNPNQLDFKSLGTQPGGDLFGYNQNTVPRTSCYHRVKDSGGNPFDPYEGYACDFTRDTSLPINKPGKVVFGAQLTAKSGFTNILPSRFQVEAKHFDSATGQIKLTATSAGQPYDGSVEGWRDTYRATLIPLKKFNGSRNELY